MLVLGDKGQDGFRAVRGISREPTVRCAGNYRSRCRLGQAPDGHLVPVSPHRVCFFSSYQEGGYAERPQLFAAERSLAALLEKNRLGILEHLLLSLSGQLLEGTLLAKRTVV